MSAEATCTAARIIDLSREKPLSLNQAREYLPGHPSHPTVFRYVVHGLAGIKLECVVMGRRRFTSLSAIQRFIDALAAKSNLGV